MSANPFIIENMQDEIQRLAKRCDELEQKIEDYVLARDVAEYERLQYSIKLFQETFGAEIISTPGFQQLWQQSEDIKNQYGGHVPTLSPAS